MEAVLGTNSMRAVRSLVTSTSYGLSHSGSLSSCAQCRHAYCITTTAPHPKVALGATGQVDDNGGLQHVLPCHRQPSRCGELTRASKTTALEQSRVIGPGRSKEHKSGVNSSCVSTSGHDSSQKHRNPLASMCGCYGGERNTAVEGGSAARSTIAPTVPMVDTSLIMKAQYEPVKGKPGTTLGRP